MSSEVVAQQENPPPYAGEGQQTAAAPNAEEKNIHDHNKWTFNRILNIAAYPISLAAGLFYARDHVRQSSLDRFRRHGISTSDSWADIHKKMKSGEIVDVKPDIIKKTSDYTKATEAIFKRSGLNSTLDHFKVLNPYGKADVLEKFGTVFGISLGALLLIANSKSVFAGDEKSHEANSGQSR